MQKNSPPLRQSIAQAVQQQPDAETPETGSAFSHHASTQRITQLTHSALPHQPVPQHRRIAGRLRTPAHRLSVYSPNRWRRTLRCSLTRREPVVSSARPRIDVCLSSSLGLQYRQSQFVKVTRLSWIWESAEHSKLVTRLIHLVLILTVSTVTTEKSFSAMKHVKNEIRNKMEDEFLSNPLTIFIEWNLPTKLTLSLS
ncbi:unnamed protein product [Cuscuta epithymum]|uniref:HAT C-terminal dimerisation domain-containing protein n=1 Tax=Cuscuta epithymum TaxID=186058 RepID=A0AAV0GBE8_9ASTE|nr:unnamed protein product [Cuscuta epithymum]